MKSKLKYEEFRAAQGLPAQDAHGGKPFSCGLSVKQLRLLGPCKAEMLDIIALMDLQKHGKVMPNVVDMSQALDRKVWKCNGMIGTPTTSQRLFDLKRKREYTCKEIFQVMGWPASELCEAEAFPGGEWRDLTGNMMVLPCVGLVMMSIMACVQFHPCTDFRQPKP